MTAPVEAVAALDRYDDIWLPIGGDVWEHLPVTGLERSEREFIAEFGPVRWLGVIGRTPWT